MQIISCPGLSIAVATAMLGAHSMHALAAHHDVQVGGNDNAFSPPNVDVMIGDTVTFTNAGGEHNVATVSGSAFSFRCARLRSEWRRQQRAVEIHRHDSARSGAPDGERVLRTPRARHGRLDQRHQSGFPAVLRCRLS
jgi:plastocyanin